MDEGKILIMNLSKGRFGEDNSKLLGGLMVTKLQLSAMSRVDIPEEDRRDFYLYVDEFQNFATESFANILSEARKYRLALVLANQYISQLIQTVGGSRSTSVRDAIFGNVGTIAAFRVGAEDAELLEKEFTPEFLAVDIVNLTKYQIYLKLMIDGMASRAFSANTLAPYPKPAVSYRKEIIEFSRKTYATAREKVEREIAEWAGFDAADFGYAPLDSKENISSKTVGQMSARPVISVPSSSPVANGGKKLYEAVCWEGGEKIMVPFQPDGVRPIYCKKHISKLTELKQQSASDWPQTVSLQEALSKNISNFKPGSQPGFKKKRPPKNPHSEPDLEELRSLLSDIKPTP